MSSRNGTEASSGGGAGSSSLAFRSVAAETLHSHGVPNGGGGSPVGSAADGTSDEGSARRARSSPLAEAPRARPESERTRAQRQREKHESPTGRPAGRFCNASRRGLVNEAPARRWRGASTTRGQARSRSVLACARAATMARRDAQRQWSRPYGSARPHPSAREAR
jgi:hypothetical protein